MRVPSYTFSDDEPFELLDRRLVAMAPQTSNHKFASDNLFSIFKAYLDDKPCKAIADGMDVYIDKNNRVVPDMTVVCDRSKIGKAGITGAPDLIVEVLSIGSVKRDRGFKMNLYERCGVKEYWIVDTDRRSVEVYALSGGRFELHNVYEALSEEDLELLTDEQKSVHTVKWSPILFPDMKIRTDDIFEDIDNY